jgi:hypothetical protein
MTVKSFVAYGLVAGLAFAAAPAPVAAQEILTARVLVEVCLPYANRQQSFEKSIRAARDLRFRRPSDDRAPLDEWASEVELVSHDGVWRLHLEENSIQVGEREAYAVTCSLSSRQASARDLSNLGRRAFRNERYWVGDDGQLRAWDRRTSDPDVRQLQVRVVEEPGARPALSIQGIYF